MDGKQETEVRSISVGCKVLLAFFILVNVITISLFVLERKYMFDSGSVSVCQKDISQLKKELEDVKNDVRFLERQIKITEKVARGRTELLKATRDKRSIMGRVSYHVDPIASMYKFLDSMVLLRNSSVVTCCNGRRGPRGKSGIKGEKGDRGEQGLTGFSGPRGKNGMKGDTGPRGPPGQAVEKPIIKVRPRDATVTQGGTTMFTCRANGYPRPIIKWYHKNTLLNNGPKVFVTPDGSSLQIKNVRQNDRGSVKCVAANILGKTEAHAALTVNVSPNVRIYKRQISIYENEMVEIQCNATGIPIPKITWDKIGATMPSNVQIMKNGFLRLFNVRKSDAGIYICKGTNSIGSSSTNVLVHVQGVYENCEETLKNRPKSDDGVYKLKSGKHYCFMRNIQTCGGSGWTLAMKLDGSKYTFTANSNHWKTPSLFRPTDTTTLPGEAKFPAFNRIRFREICVGMLFAHQIKWLRLPVRGPSLVSLFKANTHVPTSFGRNKWKNLISDSSLQRHCNREGINVKKNDGNLYVRIGIIGNQENECNSPDSFLGFGGLKQSFCGSLRPISCGNIATCSPDNGEKSLAAVGYILVR